MTLSGMGLFIAAADKDLQASTTITSSPPPCLEVTTATQETGLPLGGALEGLLVLRKNRHAVAGSFGFPRTLIFRLPKRRNRLRSG